MKTPKEQALELVRAACPELMEWTNGCMLVKNHIGYQVVNDKAWNGEIGLCDQSKNTYFTIKYEAKGFVTIGHPPQLQHWLRLLGTVDGDNDYHDENLGLLHVRKHYGFHKEPSNYISFNLTDGQPATEADYKAIVDICS